MRTVFKKSRIGTVILITVLLIINTIIFGLPKPNEEKKIVQSEKSNTISMVSSESRIITKIIDGDTVVIEGGDHVRLLGIDADERGYPCYDQARVRLEELVLSKKAQLEKDKTDKDQYKRLLRYIMIDGKNINEVLVSEGLAVARFMGDNVKYKQEIVQAEKSAIDNHVGCKWSK